LKEHRSHSSVIGQSSSGQYSKQHTKTWAAKIDWFDGNAFVTPGYNHGIGGAQKNAIDFVFHEWTNEAAGFVGYGGAGGVRAVEHLRLVMAEVQVCRTLLHGRSPRHFVEHRGRN
jgi:NAD(P)H-dependent FMN reductase